MTTDVSFTPDVSVEHKVDFIFTDLNKEGQVECSILISNDYEDEYGALEPAATAWDEDYVELRFVFQPRMILDLEIESHRWNGDEFKDKVCMDLEDKPLFDAIRAELAAMIEQIDAITFAPDDAMTNLVPPLPALD